MALTFNVVLFSLPPGLRETLNELGASSAQSLGFLVAEVESPTDVFNLLIRRGAKPSGLAQFQLARTEANRVARLPGRVPAEVLSLPRRSACSFRFPPPGL